MRTDDRQGDYKQLRFVGWRSWTHAINRSDSQDDVGKSHGFAFHSGSFLGMTPARKSHQDRQHLRYLMCNSLLGELITWYMLDRRPWPFMEIIPHLTRHQICTLSQKGPEKNCWNQWLHRPFSSMLQQSWQLMQEVEGRCRSKTLSPDPLVYHRLTSSDMTVWHCMAIFFKVIDTQRPPIIFAPCSVTDCVPARKS